MIVRVPTGVSQPLYFNAHFIDSDWDEVPGLYAFAQMKAFSSTVELFYVGKSDNFDDRLTPNHQKVKPAIERGANVVLTCRIDNPMLRSALEIALIKRYDPPLNVQHAPQTRPLSLKDAVRR